MPESEVGDDNPRQRRANRAGSVNDGIVERGRFAIEGERKKSNCLKHSKHDTLLGTVSILC